MFERSIVGSLPITIKPHLRPKEVLSLASYQPTTFPKHSRTDTFTSRPVGRSYPSSNALRRAAYAERDRTRSIDPGALDFAAEDYEDDDFEDSPPDLADAGGRGRRQALKILQSLSELPEPGMWRSLA